MLTRGSLHPTAYGLLLANKLALGLDVKCEDEQEHDQERREPMRWVCCWDYITSQPRRFQCLRCCPRETGFCRPCDDKGALGFSILIDGIAADTESGLQRRSSVTAERGGERAGSLRCRDEGLDC
ncbi:hypothetical protein DPEC_G00380350 [Dallia pectoralis]|nr:hypothetical protein DPEC_G00380350 [Dallia pectoralis]